MARMVYALTASKLSTVYICLSKSLRFPTHKLPNSSCGNNHKTLDRLFQHITEENIQLFVSVNCKTRTRGSVIRISTADQKPNKTHSLREQADSNRQEVHEVALQERDDEADDHDAGEQWDGGARPPPDDMHDHQSYEEQLSIGSEVPGDEIVVMSKGVELDFVNGTIRYKMHEKIKMPDDVENDEGDLCLDTW